MSKNYDCIVIGAGIEGLATALSLAGYGKKVLIVEQFPLPHTRGSSSGQTRLTRLAYRKPEYVRMMFEAQEKWKHLEKQTGLHLYRKTGILVLGRTNDRKVLDYKESMDICKAPYTMMSHSELTNKYSNLFDCHPEDIAMFEPEGGLLLNGHCMQALSNECKKAGVDIVDGAQMKKIIPGHLVTVVLHGGRELKANNVVITIGPWAPKFLKEQLDLELPIWSARTITTFWKEMNPGTYGADNGVPCVLFREDIPYFFKAVLEYNGLLQFGAHYAHPADPDEPERVTELLRLDYISKCRELARKYNLKIDTSGPVVIENCFYTECVDSDFILDRHPKYSNIVVGTGFSGHGFKLAPVVGDILARLVCGMPAKYDISMFSIGRSFGKISKL